MKLQLLKESLQVPFEDKNWVNKLGILVLALAITTFISGIISFSVRFPIEILNSVSHNSENIRPMLSGLSSMVSGFTSLLSIPVNLYILGYLMKYAKNIIKNEKTLLPEHKDIKETLVQALRLYVTLAIVGIPLAILCAILIGILLLGAGVLFSVAGNGVVTMILGSVLVLISIAMVFVLGVIGNVVSLSSGFIYMTTYSIRKAISPSNIFKIIQKNEKQLLNLFLYSLLISFAEALVTLVGIPFIICLGFISIPVLTVAGLLVKAYVIANYYKNMSKLEK